MSDTSPVDQVLARAETFALEDRSTEIKWPNIRERILSADKAINGQAHKAALLRFLDVPESAWPAIRVAILEHFADFLVSEELHAYFKPRTGRDETGKSRVSDADLIERTAKRAQTLHDAMMRRLSPGARRIADAIPIEVARRRKPHAGSIPTRESSTSNPSAHRAVRPKGSEFYIGHYSRWLNSVAENCRLEIREKHPTPYECFLSDLFFVWDVFRRPFALWRFLGHHPEPLCDNKDTLLRARTAFERWQASGSRGIIPPRADALYAEFLQAVTNFKAGCPGFAAICRKRSVTGREYFVIEILTTLGFSQNPKALTAARGLRSFRKTKKPAVCPVK